MENNTSTEKRVLNITFSIMSCLRIAEDLCTEMFNIPFVKKVDRKADILMTYECFNKIRRKLRMMLGEKEFDEMQEKICDTADDLEPYVLAVRNEFRTSNVRFFKYEHVEPISLGMTVNAVLAIADEMFRKVYGHRAKMMDEILENLDRFGKKYVVHALNDKTDNEIDTSNVTPHIQVLINKLIEMSMEKEDAE